MKILVIGTGYVGLVSGACLAETGLEVTCIDIDKEKIDNLKKGIIPIYEPGLERIVINNIEKKRLSFSTSIEDSLEGVEVALIAVGTPPDEDGSADLTYVLNVASDIGKYMKHYLVVATKSTVPIGTSQKVKAKIQEELDKRKVKIKFDVASNPEFLKEGDAVNDFLKPDRIIIGTESEQANEILQKLYKPFVLNGHPVISMDIASAELTKYAANAMLATKISFINDIANLCDIVGADINLVRKGIGADPRIGNRFIYAGVGYGGSCFPKDVKALIKTAKDFNYELKVLKAVEEVNEKQKEILFSKILYFFNGNLKDKKIAIWGISFKPNTDDVREAPSLKIINKLIEAGAIVSAYDPVAINEAKRKFKDKVIFGKDQYEVLIDADALVLVTEWAEFRNLNYPVISKLMHTKVIFDGRNIYDPSEVKGNGFAYFGIGRK
jgi:UDPglucose 6-dehydrogenase